MFLVYKISDINFKMFYILMRVYMRSNILPSILDIFCNYKISNTRCKISYFYILHYILNIIFDNSDILYNY